LIIKVFIGTCAASGNGGIYVSIFDTEKLFLMPAVLAGEMPSPSYLCPDFMGGNLYSVSEKRAWGSISSWLIKDTSLELTGTARAAGGGLCHLASDGRRRLLFAVSYSDGTVQTYSLRPDGSVGKLLHTVVHTGSGPVKGRQDTAHPHSVWLTPDEKTLCVCDLGMDKLLSYKIDYQSGALTHRAGWDIDFPPGSGPRHMVFSPRREYAFVLTELSREIYGLSFHPQRGFSIIESRCLPEVKKDNQEPCLGAAIRITGDGKYVYVSNRGDDSIAAVHLDVQGGMADIQRFDTHGAHPRDFILCGDDRYLLCANRMSANIVLFSRNQQDGSLVCSGSLEGINDPVCLLAIKK
jgi:6-phosphogluconolactonase